MNYGQLKAAVKGYLHRTDVDPMMPTFLALAEQRIYKGEANSSALRVSAMLKPVELVDGSMPADFLHAKRVNVAGDERKTLEYRPLSDVATACNAYSWQGALMVLGPHQTFPIDLLYYAKFGELTDDASSNWLLTNAPNVYLTSMLVEAARWARDDALGMREASNYASAVESLLSADKAAQISGSPLRMKVKNAR